MISNICRNAACAAFVALLVPVVHGAPATVPRAWLVTKGDSQAVLVGETHVGTAVENDRYFDTVIKPSFVVSDIAVMETYFGPEETRNATFERLAPCLDNPRGLRTERSRLAFHALISATRDSGLEVPNWLEAWEILPEFAFASSYLHTFAITSLGPAYNAAVEARNGPGISFRLRGSTVIPKKTIGLDTLKDRRSQFCSASAEDRADFVADSALKVANLLRAKKFDPFANSVSDLSFVGGHAFAYLIQCVDRMEPCGTNQISLNARLLIQKGWMSPISSGTFEIYVKKRTHAWIPLIEKTISDHRRSFVIVGGLHLPDFKVGSRVEPGLISLLRQRGFSVTPIAAASDITATFLSPTWFDRLRSALSSL